MNNIYWFPSAMLHVHVTIYIYKCMCVCVCVCSLSVVQASGLVVPTHKTAAELQSLGSAQRVFLKPSSDIYLYSHILYRVHFKVA